MFLKKNHSQRAAVIVLFLVLLPLITVSMVLIFELSMIQVSREQARAYVRLLSLAAAKQYNDNTEVTQTTPKERFLQRLHNVKDRVNNLAAENSLLLNKSSEDFKELGFDWSSENERKGGIILPGRYYFSKGEDEESPCSPNTVMPPCYVEFSKNDYNSYINASSSGPEPVINAFKIDAGFRDSYLTRMASSVIGQAVFKINAQAIATTIPRTVVFLVDISNSTTIQTHIRRTVSDQKSTPESGRGRYYSFALNTLDPTYPAGCNDLVLDPTSDGDLCQWRFLRDWNGAAYVHGDGIERALAPMNDKVHYWNDYQFVDAFQAYDQDGLQQKYHMANQGKYASNVSRFLVDNVSKPQPLTDILNGLDNALQAFMERQNVGDKAQFVFFETSLFWTRVTKLTGDFAYLKKLTNPDDPMRNARLKSLGVFPSHERFTNLHVALEEAVSQILANPLRQKDVPTSDAIVYIGDFLPNCYKINKAENCLDIKPCINCPAGNACRYECSDDYLHFNKAVSHINEFMLDNLVPNKISFNVIMLGDYVGPHVLNIKRSNQDPVCISDFEARARNEDFVMGGNGAGLQCPDAMQCAISYLNMSPTTPFYQAGLEAYRLARMTGGIYTPILKGSDSGACVAPSTNPCPISPKRREVDLVCRTQAKQIQDSMKDVVRGEQMFIVTEAS